MALGTFIFIPGEKLNRIQISGLCLAFVGIMVAFNESLNLPTRQMLIGDIMLTIAAVIWGATTVIIKAGPLAQPLPPVKHSYTSLLFLHWCFPWRPWHLENRVF